MRDESIFFKKGKKSSTQLILQMIVAQIQIFYDRIGLGFQGKSWVQVNIRGSTAAAAADVDAAESAAAAAAVTATATTI